MRLGEDDGKDSTERWQAARRLSRGRSEQCGKQEQGEEVGQVRLPPFSGVLLLGRDQKSRCLGGDGFTPQLLAAPRFLCSHDL